MRQVKKFESGMVVNPLTIHPDQTLADARAMMSAHRISGIPVVERRDGRLVGILTNRDVRFATDPAQRVSELMTRRTSSRSRRMSGRRRRAGSCTGTASKSCWWWTRPIAASG